MKVNLIILLSLVLFHGLLSGQTMRKYKKLSTGEGLPHIYVDRIFQSNDGLIYIATHKGLVTYDGTELSPIAIADSMHFNRQLRVDQLAQLGNQILWGTNNGLFSSAKGEQQLKTTSFQKPVKDIVVIDSGAFLLSEEKLFRWDSIQAASNLKVKELNEPITHLFKSKDGKIGLITSNDWGYLKFKDSSVSYQKMGEIPELKKIISTRNNKIIGVSPLGVWQLAPTQKFLYKHADIRDIVEGLGNRFVLNIREKGLFDLYEENETWKLEPVHTINDDVANGFFDKRINQIFSDASGAVWVATEGNGVNILMDDGQRIAHARHPLTDTYEEYGYVNTLLPMTHNELIVGCSGQGLLYWNQKTNRLDDVWLINKQDTLQNIYIEGLFQTKDGKILMGTRFNGIIKGEIDKKFKRVQVEKIYDAVDFKLNFNPSISEFFERNNMIYAYSSKGLIRMDLDKNEFEIGVNNSILKQPITDTISREGVNLIFKSNRRVYNVATALIDSVLWYGNASGLFAIENDTIVEKQIYSGITDVISSIYEGKHPFIWLGTRNGLVKYNAEKQIAVRYLWEGRLDVNSLNTDATVTLDDGRIAYGCNDGIIVNDMDSVFELPFNPLDFKEQEFENRKEFSLRNYCYNFDERCFFRYKLIGTDTIVATQQGTLFQFSTEGLMPGNYQLIVEAYNSRAELVSAPFMTQFKVAKPSQWAWLLLLLLPVIGYGLYLYFRKVKVEETVEEAHEDSTVEKEEGDSAFLKEAEEVILQNLSNTQFAVTDLYEAMQMSKSNFYRKLKQEKDLSPNEFVRLVRLEKAAEMLKNKEISVNEVAYETGFNSPSYFSRCFKQQFLMTPKEFHQRYT
ncbi:AraC family transcriptional regulator [Prolixibacteraceae bacterium JC049]|nr:AraC family transcriptional regulator [Prolixibacteraceae bacterium JC049]